ncbi:MAG TPA: ATP-binding protein [Kofleriaceae bacterium]
MGDRSELVALEGRVQRQMERLLAVSIELGRARTREDVARVAIANVDTGSSSYGGFWIIEGGALRMIEIAQGDRDRIAPLDGDAPHAAMRGAVPVFLDDAAYVPIVVESGVLGAFAVTYEIAAELDASERTFLAILGRQLGLVLERIRCDESAARAQLEADQAIHAHEEILSVVSHDLRNPLGTILMGASTLAQVSDSNDPIGQRVRTIGERINRQAERMARKIEDLVDFAGIEVGKLSIDRKQHAPARLVDSAAELLASLAQERGLVFEATTASDLPQLECDDARVSQVLANLVGNALKVTPKGGRIGVGAKLAGTEVVFFVSDTGPGLDADELPQVFQRYWRSKQATYKGAGLALTIARGIVEAHGGKIWAESERGKGCSFFFTLVPS